MVYVDNLVHGCLARSHLYAAGILEANREMHSAYTVWEIRDALAMLQPLLCLQLRVVIQISNFYFFPTYRDFEMVMQLLKCRG